jgi:hypothetical protein
MSAYEISNHLRYNITVYNRPYSSSLIKVWQYVNHAATSVSLALKYFTKMEVSGQITLQGERKPFALV